MLSGLSLCAHGRPLPFRAHNPPSPSHPREHTAGMQARCMRARCVRAWACAPVGSARRVRSVCVTGALPIWLPGAQRTPALVRTLDGRHGRGKEPTPVLFADSRCAHCSCHSHDASRSKNKPHPKSKIHTQTALVAVCLPSVASSSAIEKKNPGKRPPSPFA